MRNTKSSRQNSPKSGQWKVLMKRSAIHFWLVKRSAPGSHTFMLKNQLSHLGYSANNQPFILCMYTPRVYRDYCAPEWSMYRKRTFLIVLSLISQPLRHQKGEASSLTGWLQLRVVFFPSRAPWPWGPRSWENYKAVNLLLRHACLKQMKTWGSKCHPDDLASSEQKPHTCKLRLSWKTMVQKKPLLPGMVARNIRLRFDSLKEKGATHPEAREDKEWTITLTWPSDRNLKRGERANPLYCDVVNR